MIVFLLVLFTVTACQNKPESYSTGEEDDGITLYYLNPEGTKLVEYWFAYEEKTDDTKEEVELIMKQLQESPDLSQYKAVVTESMGFQKATVQNSYVSLDFTSGYGKLEPVSEVLCRAAIVKSMTQLPKVSNVEITINGQPITNQDGQVIGIMNGDSFVTDDSTFSNYGLYGEVSLYFANKKGTKLVECQTQLDVSNQHSLEQRVIEQLIKGPDTEKYKKTIPEGTEVIKTSVKDGICYVDFNQKFLDGVSDVQDEITIYSIVNSLVELPNINKVQFTIEGERIAKYRENIPFDGTFERNLDLCERSKWKGTYE